MCLDNNSLWDQSGDQAASHPHGDHIVHILADMKKVIQGYWCCNFLKFASTYFFHSFMAIQFLLEYKNCGNGHC